MLIIAGFGFVLAESDPYIIKSGGEFYIVYHGRDKSSDLSKDDRTARIRKLVINGKKLTVE